MLVLSTDYYNAWLRIPEASLRFWIRCWQDGLHSGTYPEWAFCPLSIPCLASLWKIFSHTPGKRDWGYSQRHAIRALAARRTNLLDGLYFPCPPDDDESKWNAYWDDVIARTSAFQQFTAQRLNTAILASDGLPNFKNISIATEAFVAEVLRQGYSDYELFVRAGTGVLDPKGHRDQPYPERFQGLIEHLQRVPENEFVVWTYLSTGASRRIARSELDHPLNWRGLRGFARLEGRPIAISRCIATHSITAFLRHRFECSDALRKRSAKFGITGLRLAKESSVYLASRPERPPWQHSAPRTTTFQYLPRPDFGIEPEAFTAAIEAVEEDPEEAIRILSDAFERQLGSNWPQAAAKSYIRQLRGNLGRLLVGSIQEMRERFNRRGEMPSWLEEVPSETPLDLLQVARAIRQSGPHADEFLACRFETVGRTDNYRSQAWITGWLYLAKGIRNREVHAGTWPSELRTVASFLARVLLSAFAASFPKPNL